MGTTAKDGALCHRAIHAHARASDLSAFARHGTVIDPRDLKQATSLRQ